MEYHRFIETYLQDTDFASSDCFIHALIERHLESSIELDGQTVRVKETILRAVLDIVKDIKLHYDCQISQNGTLQFHVEKQAALLKKIGQQLGITYNDADQQGTVWQILHALQEKQKQLDQMSIQLKALSRHKEQLAAYKRQLSGLERINERQNEMIVSYNKENAQLRQEMKGLLDDMLAVKAASSGRSVSGRQSAKKGKSAHAPRKRLPVPEQNSDDHGDDINTAVPMQ